MCGPSAAAADPVFVAGDSAGGNLTLATLLACKRDGLPPLLLQVGDAEVLLDDSVRFADRLAGANRPDKP